MRLPVALSLFAATCLAVAAILIHESPAQPTVTAPLASSASLSTASAQVIGANPTRRGITFYNQSAVVVSIRPGTTAAVASGAGTINLAATGGTLSIVCAPSLACGTAFQGIAASSSGNILTVWEW